MTDPIDLEEFAVRIRDTMVLGDDGTYEWRVPPDPAEVLAVVAQARAHAKVIEVLERMANGDKDSDGDTFLAKELQMAREQALHELATEDTAPKN